MTHNHPDLCVFDLDGCLWTPETFEVSTFPTLPRDIIRGPLGSAGEGVVGFKCGKQTFRLFPGALEVLQRIYAGDYPHMRIAAASTAVGDRSVALANAAFDHFEVVPGVTLRELFSKGWDHDDHRHLKIGRSPPLSSCKASSHFPMLVKELGIPYERMVFFDDCTWEDHVTTVGGRLGVVSTRVPQGMSISSMREALQEYAGKVGPQAPACTKRVWE